MLVLTRKTSESIMIGNDIKVSITRIDRGEGRLSIEAPREVAILRSELLERKEQSK